MVSQDEKLSFNLDPEVTSARFGTPSNIGSTLLLPIHITTQHCQNRMAAYLIEDAVVKSFEYLGGNCAVPTSKPAPVKTSSPAAPAQDKAQKPHINLMD